VNQNSSSKICAPRRQSCLLSQGGERESCRSCRPRPSELLRHWRRGAPGHGWRGPDCGRGPDESIHCESSLDLAPRASMVNPGRIPLNTAPEETEHGTRPGGRGPGGVPRGVGSKNRGGHVRVYVYPYTEGGLSPIAIFSVCLSVCPSYFLKHTRTPLHPAALASVPYGVVLVRVRVPSYSKLYFSCRRHSNLYRMYLNCIFLYKRYLFLFFDRPPGGSPI